VLKKMVNITKSSIGIIKGVPNPETNRTKVLKVLEIIDGPKAATRCPTCKMPHKCVEGYWCRKDQSFHQCTSGKCTGAEKGGTAGGAMWRVIPKEDKEDTE